MLDKFLAAVSILALIGFVSIVVVWVNELDLWIITTGVLILAVVDFVQATRTEKKKEVSNE